MPNPKSSIHYCQYDSPLGRLVVGGADGRLGFLHLPKEGRPFEPEPDWILVPSSFDDTRHELDAYFSGNLKQFTVAYRLIGTDFQMAVWHALAAIPYGALRSYGNIAKTVGRPKGSQAVGMANNANPLPIIVPCHRVIGTDGSLVGFGGGIKAKIWLLEHEGIAPSQVHTPNQMGLPF
ncbi:methylated-DNA--[protein]-cysteine S-methyltransferase [Cohaesibacter celericrescens]|uniref:methylated-DNA--[protein]-cysteine S-methyltransferase n=1 Tax=Cohaesibacter celericrescens TaxID=2067669 RepID=UPI0035663439